VVAVHSEDGDEAGSGSSADKDISLPSGCTLRRNTFVPPVLSTLIVSETMASDGESAMQASEQVIDGQDAVTAEGCGHGVGGHARSGDEDRIGSECEDGGAVVRWRRRQKTPLQ
jgi:hypothetical protein